MAFDSNGGRPTVLVVEDEPAVREVLEIRLRDEGWAVKQAATMAEAFPICEATPPDVLVLDHSMPGMTGIEAGRLLVREGFASPIVIFSAYLTRELKDDCHALGLRAVDKINWDELVLTCRELLLASRQAKPASASV
jgi:CheY-like chemotaxis protein